MNHIDKKIVVVLGMHRSGTSSIARALKVLGIDLGDSFLPSMEHVNAKGFWEDADINELNIDMLSVVSSDWMAITSLTEAQFETLRKLGFYERAKALIQEKLADSSVFGFKDPRVPKLLPFWREVLHSCQCSVDYVVTLRNPKSVAQSLKKRDNLDEVLSYFLWLEHVLASLRGTEGQNRVLVDYDLLMRDPQHEIERLGRKLGYTVDIAELHEYTNKFLDQSLRHNHFDVAQFNDDKNIPAIVTEVFSILRDVAEDKIDLDSPILLNQTASWKEQVESLDLYLGVIDRLQSTIVQIKSAMDERDVALTERDIALAEREQAIASRDATLIERNKAIAELDAALRRERTVLTSMSWRITRPLRVIARTARHGINDSDKAKVIDALGRRYRQLPLPRSLRRALSLANQRKTRRPAAFQLPQFKPALVESSKPDYFMFGIIDWHFRHQRPQQIATAIAATGRRVFFISPEFIYSEQPGFKVEQLDDAGRLFSIKLHLSDKAVIYKQLATTEQLQQVRDDLALLVDWANIAESVALVQHPFWHSAAADLPSCRLVYDCMDHHEGFGGVPEQILEAEKEMFGQANLTITTSSWLEQQVAELTPRHALIRNAGEFTHFSTAPADIYQDPKGRKIIGYYGAIAEWFDVALVAAVAKAFPQCSVTLIGADTINARGALSKYRNVVFLGEIPYRELPRYAHAFDVCLLPFKVIPLTMATNPVKVYEYLGMGKPVVAVDLPEMHQFGELCWVANDNESFISAVREALSDSSVDQVNQRQAFALDQSWSHRAEEVIGMTEASHSDPLVSIIVVTYNNLDLTKQCLASVDQFSHYDNVELIVVDNASSDGSPAWLENWVQGNARRRLILNQDNRGFAAGNNQGLDIAKGDYLVMLNNDTHVTPGWVRTLVNHMHRDPGLGLLGPVTNNIGNEAKIQITYDNMSQMIDRAAHYTRARMGKLYPLRTAAFFCVMMRRATFTAVGPLDEVFGRGFFEDDDYCRRVEQLGLRIACAEDVFIHHQLSASFNKLRQQDRKKLFDDNKKVYEAKWGMWIPHGPRSEPNQPSVLDNVVRNHN